MILTANDEEVAMFTVFVLSKDPKDFVQEIGGASPTPLDEKVCSIAHSWARHMTTDSHEHLHVPGGDGSANTKWFDTIMLIVGKNAAQLMTAESCGSGYNGAYTEGGGVAIIKISDSNDAGKGKVREIFGAIILREEQSDI